VCEESQENLEVARAFYEAMARDEFPADVIDPDVEYVNPPGAIEPGTRRGIEELRRVIEKVREGWETWRMEPQELTAVGDRVIVVIRYRARGRTSGVELEGLESALLTFRDGKITRYEWFHGPDDAQRAAGAAG
jgi:ketosteroid isomerase-like protein